MLFSFCLYPRDIYTILQLFCQYVSLNLFVPIALNDPDWQRFASSNKSLRSIEPMVRDLGWQNVGVGRSGNEMT